MVPESQAGDSAKMVLVRPPAVADMFYPSDTDQLDRTVSALLADALRRAATVADAAPVKAIIAPHAGYVYSGATAARAYAALAPQRGQIRRVVLMGPCHRVAVDGLATTSADLWQMPFGPVRIDPDVRSLPDSLPQVTINDAAHRQEHALEVHLPFLQKLLPGFTLLPFAVGRAGAAEVAAVLEYLWGGPETAIVISTDLSHYLPYAAAQERDAATAAAIEALDETAIDRDQACGRVPLSGMLTAARHRGLGVTRLGLCNSGDTAGDKDRVVGYGSWSLQNVA